MAITADPSRAIVMGGPLPGTLRSNPARPVSATSGTPERSRGTSTAPPSGEAEPGPPAYGPGGRLEGMGSSTVEATPEGDEGQGVEAERPDEQNPRARGEEPRQPGELSPEEEQQVEELAQRDREVRAHEQAHLASGGSHARGGATYTFQQGPDGRAYAIGGSVSIDTSPVLGDPEATAAKARQVRAAAMAPADPSGADRAIAARASQMEANAMNEVVEQQREEGTQAAEESEPTPGTPAAEEAGATGTPWDKHAEVIQEAQGGSWSVLA